MSLGHVIYIGNSLGSLQEHTHKKKSVFSTASHGGRTPWRLVVEGEGQTGVRKDEGAGEGGLKSPPGEQTAVHLTALPPKP